MTTVLGIETTCDETAAAVVRDGRFVLSSVVASQHDLHGPYRGVVPEIASRAHLERLLPAVDLALEQAGATLDDLDAVAVAHRPGLIGPLLVGVASAKALAWARGLPLVGVDHVHAHLYAPWLIGPGAQPADPPAYPAIGLVVSGGHSAIYHLTGPTELRRLGSTIDDAVGEAFDKAATILGLPYPGGPEIDRLARSAPEHTASPVFPVSRLDPDSLDFSFSGLKTALLYAVRGTPGPGGAFPRDHTALTDQERAALAAGFQRAAVDAIILKLRRAVERTDPPPRSLLVGGGVTANSLLREELARVARDVGVPVHVPPVQFCLDNAAMIAGLAAHRLCAGADDGLRLTPVPTTAA